MLYNSFIWVLKVNIFDFYGAASIEKNKRNDMDQ
jgi:hypothetical protein